MMWEKVKIGDVYEGLYDGPHATPPTSDDGAIFLGISNITKDGISIFLILNISMRMTSQSGQRELLQKAEILFSRMRQR